MSYHQADLFIKILQKCNFQNKMLFFFAKIPIFSSKNDQLCLHLCQPTLPNVQRPWKQISRNSDRGQPSAKQGIKGISNLSLFKDLYLEQWQWQEGHGLRAVFGTGIKGYLQGWWKPRIAGYLPGCGAMGTGGHRREQLWPQAVCPVRCHNICPQFSVTPGSF